eukprot:TRINITY_DN2541_c0_g1_i1.p1 TRINITY_DN2541_c0_g1~~TRINITY_DN2541_c0_g1_i1.p1  ORF type:complete len:706 (+),score=176.21 TRINITY_DN2541_c0_g1_i1:100-2217(+)
MSSKPEDLSDEGWSDITEKFFVSLQDVASGQIIQRDGFYLEDAMSAVEVMDPRMDLFCAGPVVSPKNWKPAGEIPHDVVILILSQITRQFCSYLNGEPPAYNLFTNYFMHDFRLAIDPAVECVARCALFCARTARSWAAKSRVHDEEEFCTSFFGIKVQRDSHNMVEAEGCAEAVECRLKDAASLDTSVERNILDFVSFWMLMAKTFHFLDSLESRKDAETCLKNMFELLRLVDVIPLTGIGDDAITAQLVPYGVDYRLCARMVGCYPVRATIKISDTDVRDILRKTLSDCADVCHVIENAKDLYGLLEFLEVFAIRSAREDRSILARSILCVLINGANADGKGLALGTSSVRSLIEKRLSLFPTWKKAASDKTCVEMVDRLDSVLRRYIYILCMNRAKLHRKMGNFMKDAGTVQDDATLLDAHLFPGTQAPLFLGFVMDFTMHSGIVYLFLCESLGLLHQDEFPHVLWYEDYFLHMRCSYATLCEEKLVQYMLESQVSASSGGKGKKAKKGGKKKIKKPLTMHLPMSLSMDHVHGLEHLIRGIYRGVIGLLKMGKKHLGDSDVEKAFGSNESRYQYRLRPLFDLPQPQHVSYEEFLSHSATDVSADTLIKSGLEQITQAKSYLEKVKEARSSLARFAKASQRRDFISETIIEEMDLLEKCCDANKVGLELMLKVASSPAMNARFQHFEMRTSPQIIIPVIYPCK